MIKFIFLRVFQAIPVLLFVITITFVMVRSAPGGPFDEDRAAPPEVIKNLNEKYNLDAPIYVQYFDYLKQLAQGDFGPSFKYPNRSVNEMIYTGFPITLELALYAMLFAIFVGVPIGAAAALKPNSIQDYLPMSVSMLGICLPSFVLGPVLVLIFGIWFELLPVSGWGVSAGDKILPTVTLGSTYAAYIARITRGGMLEVLSMDYIRTARAKGLNAYNVVIKHALRPGITPVVTFLGPAIAGLLGGSFVVETIFQIPGLGRFYIQAAFNRDYTMILGTTIFFAALILLFNLISDVILVWLNPKLRKAPSN